MKTIRVAAVALLMACVVAANAASSQAAPGAGWALTANTYPTNFGEAVNAEQEIFVNEAGEPFTLGYEGLTTPALPNGASDAEVQSALEGLASIGAGNVRVTSTGEHEHTLTFQNLLGGVKIKEVEASGASVTVKTRGASSGTIGIAPLNVGAGESHGTITVTDVLPPGVVARQAGQLDSIGNFGSGFGVDSTIRQEDWNCTGNGAGPSPKVSGATTISCVNDPSQLASVAGGGGVSTGGEVPSPEQGFHLQPEIGIAVDVLQGQVEGTKAGVEGNHVAIAGGGALEAASTTTPVTFSHTPAKGIAHADVWFSNEDGTSDLQAGSHPYLAGFAFTQATAVEPGGERQLYFPGGEPRDLETQLPAGIIGNLSDRPKCTRAQLVATLCPPESEVGVVKIYSALTATEQVFNMVPEHGVPAELGFEYSVPTYITFSTKNSGAVIARVNNIAQGRQVFGSTVVLWGAPNDASHNIWRYGQFGCSTEELETKFPNPSGGHANYYCHLPAFTQPVATLRLPTSCAGPQRYVARELNTWQSAAAETEVSFVSHDGAGQPAGFTGCDALGVEPAFAALLESARADSPTGLVTEIQQSLSTLTQPEDLSSADVRTTTVTLPEGLVINPGQAAGLQSCPPGRPGAGQFGDALTTPSEEAEGKEDTAAASCPLASRIGSVTIKSPLIEGDPEQQLEGGVYVLPSDPPDVKLLVAASGDGVNIKQVGVAHLDEVTGRVTATFQNIAQLPFSNLKVTFDGGSKAALVSPVRCGVYQVGAEFTPWSAPFAPASLTSGAFAISEAATAASCPSGALPFVPSLVAGTTATQAGGFTAFTTLLQRGDGQQRVEKFALKTPAGLSGLISKVPLCPEPQAAQGACPGTSQLGHAVVESGPGASPLVIPQPGEPEAPIYLTGPYAGAPFGLSIVTPVIAGPFNLGTIVTRARIEVDPITAQITVATDPLPQILHGVPTNLRSIYAVIDRPGFIINPTNCNAQEFTGTAWGSPPPGEASTGTTAKLTSRFGLSGCRELAFNPTVAVTTGAKASKANGAGLSFKISYPKGAMGTQSWFSEAKFVIPKQLPSRLTTLQQACLAATYETNRANCPAGSKIGHAVVHTQVLPEPLEGPVYFVSYGGAKFPDAVMDLRGDNVHVELHGETLISKGVTSATFRNAPDVPFENIEVNVPTGPFSELGANLPHNSFNFCGQHLTMPTLFKAQNGLEIHESTPVRVSGCGKARTNKQKLAAALKACHKRHGSARRQACERAAHKRYVTTKANTKKHG